MNATYFMKRKIFKYILLILISTCILSILLSVVDISLLTHDKPPFFSPIKVHYNDGGTIIYYGLGYQIVKWKRLAEDESGKVYVGIEKHYLFGIKRLDSITPDFDKLKLVDDY